MRNVRRFVVCSLGLAVVCFTFAQAQEAPKPVAEHERLGFWVGDWTNKGEVMENPMMPSGKFTSTDHCVWFEGKFSVVCHTEGEGPMGAMKSIGIMSYSPELGVYTYYGTESTGMAMTSVPKGKIDGKTWVYNDEMTMGEATMNSRYTIVETSASSYTFKWQMQSPDGEWMTIMQGKGKRE